jgi:hypothetical protein
MNTSQRKFFERNDEKQNEKPRNELNISYNEKNTRSTTPLSKQRTRSTERTSHCYESSTNEIREHQETNTWNYENNEANKD